MFRRKKDQPQGDRTDAFMALVEQHEREWGEKSKKDHKRDHYEDRPALKDVLRAPVVAFWSATKRKDTRQRITLHKSIEELNTYLHHFLLERDEPTERVLSQLFIAKEPVHIKGVRLVLALDDED